MMEKYIDLTAPGAQYDINRYIANGWRIKEQGLTLLTLEKEEKTYSIIASEFIKVMKTLCKKQANLDNFEAYLTYHFPEWLEKHANTPGGIVAELKMFVEMD